MVLKAKILSFHEAREAVWASSVFTTHTPVMAGNEHFDPELVRKYLEVYATGELGIGWDEFLSIGKEEQSSATFCMTVVALRLAAYLNGVSKLHGEVSRGMWRKVWPELPFEEIPITSITNGVHTSSWISHEHLNLYTQKLAPHTGNGECEAHPSDTCDWSRIGEIPDEELWAVHEIRKQKLINLVRARIKRQLARQGADVTVLNETAKLLDPKVLTIGFARRFATYKRATLIFRDIERLAAMIANAKMPLQIVFAGKAHQADSQGKELIKFILGLTDDERFRGKIVFVEDYNMNVARYLTQGVDVWMNNPIRPMEASGTSGMKAAINGVLNLSVLDGWWCEAYDTRVGWAVGGSEHYNDDEERDNVESEAICNLIEKQIAPLYYDRDSSGLPRKWIAAMKASVGKITPHFSTHRMVREYYDRFYVPAHRFGKLMVSDGKAKKTAQWRARIKENWPQVRLENETPRIDHEIRAGDAVPFKARVWLGNLSPDDVSVEIYAGRLASSGELSGGTAIAMKVAAKEGDSYVYSGEISASRSGRQDFALRVLPRHDGLPHPFMPAFIKWEE